MIDIDHSPRVLCKVESITNYLSTPQAQTPEWVAPAKTPSPSETPAPQPTQPSLLSWLVGNQDIAEQGNGLLADLNLVFDGR